MITAFDRIIIEVPDLAAASADYQLLLGQRSNDHLFRLGNVDILLQQAGTSGPAAISKLSLLDENVSTDVPVDTGARGLSLSRSHFRDPAYHENTASNGIFAVDHLVLQTRDADDCIRLFAEQLGLRLALDQEVPEWGGRMLFFRLGKMTLEVIHNRKEPPAKDLFWGITYHCKDIDLTIACLDEHGIAHSPIRAGRKPGTRVATVRSHCLGLPTLLLGPQ